MRMAEHEAQAHRSGGGIGLEQRFQATGGAGEFENGHQFVR
jgi:hypothetical protein